MPKIVNKQIKSQEIGRAALGVFRKYGYHRTTMADIARAASVGKGTLYEYFKDKADILRFTFDDYFSAFKEGAVRAIAGTSDPGERLAALMEFALDHVAQWEEHCAIYLDYLGVAKREEKEGLFSLDRFYEEFQAILKLLIEESQAAGKIRQEFDPGSTAELLLALFDGVVLHGIFAEKSGNPALIHAAALKLVSYGLFKDKECRIPD
jgi:AcrR family transcriptional regulator